MRRSGIEERISDFFMKTIDDRFQDICRICGRVFFYDQSNRHKVLLKEYILHFLFFYT
ncbi:hypothetical protein [Aneurinibacillus migulanus]|uniref:hypothetical protein n=1 Tax=Aneurinibacillus migulanus TaxID=47500 RepID=UPI000AB2E9FC|nr:hypothetical protein [Aneurinibacillus migulanus]MCP1357016.1 hypothetical protein [Aneurinibacillus migulanus]MED4730169.1 hypothetical protein [Aneurinibacillus migulanus]